MAVYDPFTGWDLLGLCLGLAGGVLAVGLALLAVVAGWFLLLGWAGDPRARVR